VVVPGAIDQGFVAFGLRTGSPLRRDINAALLRVLESDEWPRLRQEYLQR
jgi:ABC-type amino acid transport substrate-binding protein